MCQRSMRRMATVRLVVWIGATVIGAATGVRVVAQTPADVAGYWVLTVTTDTGTGTSTPSLRLERNGAELTGDYSSAFMGENEVTGSVDGNDIRFSFEWEFQDSPVEIVFTGTVREDGTLSGKVSLGSYGGGIFTGEPHPGPPPPPERRRLPSPPPPPPPAVSGVPGAPPDHARAEGRWSTMTRTYGSRSTARRKRSWRTTSGPATR